MTRTFLRHALAILITAVLSVVSAAHGALVLQWQMNNPTPLDDSVGTNDLNLGNPPTFLPTGGVGGSGAYLFSAPSQQYLYPNLTYPTPTNIGSAASDWTTSFWIKTTDAGTATTYVGSPHIPVLGENNGGPIGFSLGVSGGTASFRHYTGSGPFSGWVIAAGSTPLANNDGHFVTFVYHGGPTTVDIYIDGIADTLGQPAGVGAPYNFSHVGLSCCNQYANMTLDDVRIYNTALSAIEIKSLFGPPQVPEPSTLALVGIGAVGLGVRRRRQRP